MAELFFALLEMSLRGSYIILILLAARLLLRRAPRRLVCLLWLVAFFRLACPVGISSAFSLLPSGTAFSPPQQLTQVLWAGETVQGQTQGYIGVSARGITPMQILCWVWLAGADAMVVSSLLALWRLRRALRGAVRAPDGVFELEGLPTAFIVGVFRPRIYLPAGLTEQERRFVLQHERIHLRRGDWVVKLLAHFVLCLHWFNPLVWLAFRLLCRDIEIACDERVVQQLGEEQRGDYSRTLLRLAGGGRFRSALAFGEGDVEGRIRHLLGRRTTALAVTVGCGVLVVALAAALLLDPADPRPQWLRQLQPDQLARAELIHSKDGQVSAVWFEAEQLEPLADALRGAKAAQGERGPSETLLDSGTLPQLDGLYLLMADGTVHSITSADAGAAQLMIDGAPYKSRGGWAEILQQPGGESGISQQMAQAVADQQELLYDPLQRLAESASYDEESETLTFTVPQALEAGNIRLNIALITADGQQWQGFSKENSTGSWTAGRTYTAQVEGLERMVAACSLGGISLDNTVEFGGGYLGLGASNLPQG